MRKAFVNGLISLAEKDPRVLLLTGDLGFMVLEPFIECFPDRFINVGAAEQNMFAVATGLAEAGYVPFVYSISPFATLRPLEFLRNGPIFHQLPVRVVSVGGGFAYGFGGKSHHAVEDLAILRSLTGLLTIVPADSAQAASSVQATAAETGPVFFRLDKNDRDQTDGLDGKFGIGRLEIVQSGSSCSIIAMGSIATEAVAAANQLRENGISATVAIVSSFNPAPEEALQKLPRPWITVEEHVISGGLGGWVAETSSNSELPTKILRCGVSKTGPVGVGSQQWFREYHGIDAAGIAKATQSFLLNSV